MGPGLRRDGGSVARYRKLYFDFFKRSKAGIRRDCFAALAMTTVSHSHCEERSDEAIPIRERKRVSRDTISMTTAPGPRFRGGDEEEKRGDEEEKPGTRKRQGNRLSSSEHWALRTG